MNRRAFLKGLASLAVAPAMAPVMKFVPAPLCVSLTNWAMRTLADGTILMTVNVNFHQ